MIILKFPGNGHHCQPIHKCYTENFKINHRQNFIVFRFLAAGGKIIKEEIKSFDRLFDDFDIVFNCTGLGAAELTNDTELTPIRGQTVRVDTGTVAQNTFVYIHTGTPMIPYYYWT